MADQALTNVGLFVRLEAKTGREGDVEVLMKKALQLVDEEPDTTVWFSFRLGPTTFGIFDTFPDDSGRQAHLQGAVASALKERGPELLAEDPSIEPLDILAAKLPALASSQQ
jgi:quinol monooxygenase YgiN